MQFRTHTGEIVKGERLTAALKRVAAELRANAHAVYEEDAYAAHVTAAQKQEYLIRNLARADEVEGGKIDNFTIWQCVNTVLTGECVALLSK